MIDSDELDALLCEALDSTDDHRLALVLALCLSRPAEDRETELARMRQEGPARVAGW